MLYKTTGADIGKKLGKIKSLEQSFEIFKTSMDDTHFSRISKIQSSEILIKIANAINICKPDSIYINTGSKEDREFIKNLALKNGEESSLSIADHTIHYDLKEEQGRIIDRTFYIVDPGQHVSTLANKMDRAKATREIKENLSGIMKKMTMIIGFYIRGPLGAVGSNPALEITSSAYVAHSAEILYRNIFSSFNKEIERTDHFFTNIHSQGKNRSEDLPNARVFMDRSNRTTYSFNCTYAGNTLLLKKGNHRFAVDRAVYEKRGKELSEHMFITGIKGPGGRTTWCAGAAPSGCGKTTTAMAGDLFVGDDLAQMWLLDNGDIQSINPECGIFGILQDVNIQGDPLLMDILRKPGAEVIWSNVLVDDKKIPHWEGSMEKQPEKGINFQGKWTKNSTDENGNPIPISHPNARCTVSSTALKNYSTKAENKNGVTTKIFTYSGRDNDTMPPVWVAKNPCHGVAIGACIVSKTTATEVGASGVKRAPFANAPFIPGALSDYIAAQFEFFGNKLIPENKKPVLAGLNYFLTHKARKGTSDKLLGEKKDVKVWLSWLERYVHNEVKHIKTPMGNIPAYNDLKKLFKTIINKEYSLNLYNKQFSIYVDNIIARLEMQIKAYREEKGDFDKLFDILNEQREGLLELKKQFGSIVTPESLSSFKI
ncbi:MAG: phosphoenolpyruvate carboxykinase (GTP) [Thermodesulfobacteriota bacterium]|nr:phosphoenolpyruvate carboxykinase (GTP) [Thermodesulfobacteriota bacterium]